MPGISFSAFKNTVLWKTQMAVACSSRPHGSFLVTLQLQVSLMSLWPGRATQHSQCRHYFLFRRDAGNVPRPGRLQDPMAHIVWPLIVNWATEGREKTACFVTCSGLKPWPKNPCSTEHPNFHPMCSCAVVHHICHPSSSSVFASLLSDIC